MSPRRLAVVVAVAAGCQGASTGVRVRLSGAADAVRVSVFDRYGRVVDGARLAGALPGDVAVRLSADAVEARVLAIGLAGRQPADFAAGRVAVSAGHEASLGLALDAAALADRDGDGVPDVIDNCPDVANPTQAAHAGGSDGDACADGAPDGGTSDGGGVVAVCGDGVVTAPEECDQGAANSDDPASGASCTTRCRRRARCGAVADALAAAVDPLSGHCYLVLPGPATWAAADRDCQARGASLAVLTSASEATSVQALVGKRDAWIGLTIQHLATPRLRWVDGEPVAYTGWGSGEPNNGGASGVYEECGIVAGRTTGAWDDRPCGFAPTGTLPPSPANALAYVCESSCGNGRVEPGEGCDPPGPGCTATCQRRRPCSEAGAVSSPVNGHCYFPLANNVSYDDARAACPADAHLATLDDVAESEAGLAAIANLAADAEAWFALLAPATVGQLGWDAASDDVFNSRRYHGFLDPEPNETAAPACARLVAGFGWKDQPCARLHATLCERD